MITVRTFLAAAAIAAGIAACQGVTAQPTPEASTHTVTATATTQPTAEPQATRTTRPTGEPVTDRAVKRAAQDHFDAWGARDFGAVYDQWTRQGRDESGVSRRAYVRIMKGCFPETVHLTVVKVTRAGGLAVVRGANDDGSYTEYSVLHQDGEWRIVPRGQSLRYIEQCEQRS